MTTTIAKVLVLGLAFAMGCTDEETSPQPTEALAIDATTLQPTAFDFTGWGDACTRPSYGLTTCTNAATNAIGYCVAETDVCMPACEGVNYSCPDGAHQEYSEHSECYCAPN